MVICVEPPFAEPLETLPTQSQLMLDISLPFFSRLVLLGGKS